MTDAPGAKRDYGIVKSLDLRRRLLPSEPVISNQRLWLTCPPGGHLGKRAPREGSILRLARLAKHHLVPIRDSFGNCFINTLCAQISRLFEQLLDGVLLVIIR